jgi:hypothetical protein
MWPNGKALDYELRDSRFDPVLGHYTFNAEEGIFYYFFGVALCFLFCNTYWASFYFRGVGKEVPVSGEY